jgi:hypothetical protein
MILYKLKRSFVGTPRWVSVGMSVCVNSGRAVARPYMRYFCGHDGVPNPVLAVLRKKKDSQDF